ncbi:MAG TPA: hypothetical protein DEB15_01965 [Pusillimonas sp.]|jgi:hypothetical protein|nr:hypothetical protein [Pusillimonas sp.]MBC42583.1 hypothetical protein [Pusillimonas sp.]HBT31672.1 hypothetical protein [Pusillimonas sp.]HCP77840.1 hypothetical protein [Pusillimonas sp.]|tara:strand:+ start:10585 stop:10863 length:279 start_codon:yes stop_codon:yes gene_type:complete
MKNSKIKVAATALFLVGSIGTFSAIAHESEGKKMMSSDSMQGMGGMMGMMNMMSDMSPEDRKAMTEACMKMMQNYGSDTMSGAEHESVANAN